MIFKTIYARIYPWPEHRGLLKILVNLSEGTP